MIRTFSASLIALTLAGPALAGTSFTATLEVPVEKTERVVAAKKLWKCSDTICVATLDRKTVKVSTCKKVAKEVGRLAEFSNGEDSLSGEDLARCNSLAK